MAAIDYNGITTTIRDTIATEVGSDYYVTANMAQPAETRPWVAIYLDGRTPTDNQPIAAGTRQRYTLNYSIWCWCWSLNGPEHAGEARDDLMGLVETALMENRKMGGLVENGVLAGGEFQTAKDDKGVWLMGGEIIYRADVTATI